MLFPIEYAAGLVTASSSARYARSLFGIVDFLAVGPVYLSFVFGVTRSFSVFRSLRLLRVLRILKPTQFVGEAAALRIAVVASTRKIVVFLFAVITIVIIVGALMYQIEARKMVSRVSRRGCIGRWSRSQRLDTEIFLRTPWLAGCLLLY